MKRFVVFGFLALLGYILGQIISNFYKNSGRSPKVIQMTRKPPDYKDQDEFIQSVVNTIKNIPSIEKDE